MTNVNPAYSQPALIIILGVDAPASLGMTVMEPGEHFASAAGAALAYAVYMLGCWRYGVPRDSVPGYT